MKKAIKDMAGTRTYALAGIIAILLVYMVLLRLLLSGGGSSDKLLKAKQQKYAREAALFENRDKLEAAYAPFREEFGFGKGFSPEQANARLLKELEAIFLQAGLRIVDVKVLPVTEEDSVSQYLIQLEAEGSMEQLLALLYRIGSGQELICMEHLSLERKDAGSDLLNVRAVLGRYKL